MSNLSDFSEEEFSYAKEKLKISLLDGVSSFKEPFAVLTGGQPGSGKTTIARIFQELTHEDIVFINGDDFRKLHPNFLEIYKEYGSDFATYTGEFSGRMVQEIIESVAEYRANMIIEGTLRTASVPDFTRSYLQEKGYEVDLAIMVVRPEISYLSTLKRFNQMLENGTSGRKTNTEDHDVVVNKIIGNLDKLYKENKFNDILLFNRNKECLYEKIETPDKNPADLIKKEFNRNLTKEEIDKIILDYQNYVDKIK